MSGGLAPRQRHRHRVHVRIHLALQGRTAGGLFVFYYVGSWSQVLGAVLEILVTFLVHLQKSKTMKKVRKGKKRKRGPRGNATEGVREKGLWPMT